MFTNCSKSVFPWKDNPFRLWSLLDMLKVSAEEYIKIGEIIRGMYFKLELESIKVIKFKKNKKNDFRKFLVRLKKQCDKLELSISSHLLKSKIKDLPKTGEELELLSQAVKEEIKSNLFLFIPGHRAKYYELNLPEYFTASFPRASREIVKAGNCYAVGEYTACVFHCMRGAEIGLRSLAKHLNIPFQDLELEQWKNIIDKIEAEIKAKQGMNRGPDKVEELKFCSDAASQFRYFKDAYRNHVAHARSTYDDGEAERIMRSTREFTQSLSAKLKE